MQEEIFRKKSLNKIKTPENMNDYIAVTNPGASLLLIGAIVLMIGVCIWGVFGHIQTTVNAEAFAENGTVICLVQNSDVNSVKEGMEVRIGDVMGTVSQIGEQDIVSGTCEVFVNAEVSDGNYQAKIITEEFAPASFVLN